MNEKPKGKVDVVFAPSFAESMKNIPEKDREEIFAAIAELTEKIADNPYLGTPYVSGFFAPFIVFSNFIRRTLWRIGIRL